MHHSFQFAIKKRATWEKETMAKIYNILQIKVKILFQYVISINLGEGNILEVSQKSRTR